METSLTPATPSAIPPLAISNGGSGFAAPADPAGASMVQMSIVPARSAIGYVFKVTEKDTGRVVLELPFPPSPAEGAAGEAPLPPLVDFKA